MIHVTAHNNNSNRTGSGISFIGLLTIVFVVLKLLGVITWSWVWVLSPIWITLVLILIVAFIAIIFTVGNN